MNLTRIFWFMVSALLFSSCVDQQPVREKINPDDMILWSQLPNEKIVFMSKADSPQGELYLIDKEGNITRLTYNNRHENNPALSFDGGKVAFHGGDINNPLSWEIYILDLESMEESRLTDNNVLDGHPDWSPDGRNIVFASYLDAEGNPSAGEIYIINVDGSNLTQLTDSPWEDSDPEWSPDGAKIVFKSTRDTKMSGREEIYVMDADGGNVRRLTITSGNQSDHDPSWSPDSKSIVFLRFEGERLWSDLMNPEVFPERWQEIVPVNTHTVDLSGNDRRITDVEHISGLPYYSADGLKILTLRLDFSTVGGYITGGNFRLFLMDIDGGNQKQLISDSRHTPTMEYFEW